MGPMILKNLDFEKMRRWVENSKDKQATDPVFAFISAWIGFNYFYYTFASTHGENTGRDRDMLFFLIDHRDFATFFSEYRERNRAAFEAVVDLPIVNLLNGKRVPADVAGPVKLENLNNKKIFQIVYQIRNNLFHGRKDPKKNARDRELSEFACELMTPFLGDLIKNTYGEVRSIT
jgi:hypothetical protein